MSTDSKSLTARPVWNILEVQYRRVNDLHLRALFTDDPDRGMQIIRLYRKPKETAR